MKQKEERNCARCAHCRGQYNPCGKQPIGIVSPYTECCSEFEEKCCGNCCWFYAEDTYGYGCCPFQFGEVAYCGDACKCEGEFVSKSTMRHYQAVLLQHNRWRRDNNVPNNYRMVDVKELGRAIDFAVKYVKVFSNL